MVPGVQKMNTKEVSMGIVDMFSKEDRIEVKFSDFYTLVKESAKCELLMNAIKCDVPHRYMREMATGKSEAVSESCAEKEDVSESCVEKEDD